MFFADHYAGYWKHGEHGGHLFGTISRAEGAAEKSNANGSEKSSASGNAAGREQVQKQSGQK
jgi:hypothetical protein